MKLIPPTPATREYFKGVDLVCLQEISEMAHTLWADWSTNYVESFGEPFPEGSVGHRKRIDWEQGGATGYLLTIGHLCGHKSKPVCLSVMTRKIGTKNVLFVYPTSRYVDWTAIEEYVKEFVQKPTYEHCRFHEIVHQARPADA